MRKLLLGLVLFTSFDVIAQDLQTVLSAIASNDYLSAKKQIDNYFLEKKNNPDVASWYYKARIYTEVVRQHEKADHEILQEAFRAYKRYQESDPGNKLMQLNDNVDLFQLYDLSYNTAADFYNDKSYQLAYNFFRIALDVEEYIRKKGFSFQGKSFPSLDTSLVNLTGSAAYLSNREGEAILYFERLANAKIVGEEYKGVYALLYNHYSRKNDQAKAAKYLTTAKELFPDNGYWIKMELGNALNESQRFSRYEQLIQKYPAYTSLQMDYAIELFNYIYADAKPPDFLNKQNRLQTLLTKALAADANAPMANFVMSQHVYNQVYEMEEELRGMKEDTQAEQNKKKNFTLKLDQKYEELLSFSLKTYNLYAQDPKPEIKDNCRKILNQLITCYQKKKQADKVSYYQEKLKNL